MARYYECIFRPGKYERSGTQYEGKNKPEKQPISGSDLLYFFQQGLLLWSDHPEHQYAMALGQWKKRRREAYQAGLSTPKEPMPQREDFTHDVIKVPAPRVLPAGVPQMLEPGIKDLRKPDPPQIEYEVIEQEYEYEPPQVKEPDGEAISLEVRYLGRDYKSLKTFAYAMRKDLDYIERIAAENNWSAKKAAQSRGD